MNDDTITAFPILNAKIQTELINHIEHVRDFLNEAFRHHATGRLDLGDTISWVCETTSDYLDERMPLTDSQAEQLVDFMAACVIAIAQAPGPHHDEEAEPLIPACFTPRYRAVMCENEAVLMTIAGEVMQMLRQNEADPHHIVPYTVDRFISYLADKGIKVTPTFRRAITDYVLLGTLHHFVLNK